MTEEFRISSLHFTVITIFNFVGLLRDVSGTYLISLYGTSGFMFLALILCLISMVMHSRIKSHREDTEEITIESDEPDFNVTRF